MSVGLTLAIAAASGAVASLALGALAIQLAPRLGLLDQPGGWKVHGGATPYAGWAVVGAAAAGTAVALRADTGEVAVPLAAAAVLCVLGMRDDVAPLRALPRVVAEVGAGVALYLADFAWRPTGVDALDVAATCILVLAAINALNLIDLMDGVATASAGVCALGSGLILADSGLDEPAALAIALAGACAAFLTINLASPSRAFLGDGGTMPIGLLLATVVIAATANHETAATAVAPLLLLAVPAADMAYRIAHRLYRGIPLLSPGRDSLATHLENRFGSPRPVAGLAALAQGVAVLAAAEVLEIGGWQGAVSAVAVGIAVLVAALSIRRGALDDILADAAARGTGERAARTTLSGMARDG